MDLNQKLITKSENKFNEKVWLEYLESKDDIK